MVDLQKGGVGVSGVRWCLRFVAAVVTLAAMLSGLPTAVADGKLPFGGGAGIIVDGSYCTLATIGHDNTGELVGFTAAHCGGPGAQVVAEGAEDRGPLGTVATANDGRLDYSVIRFDPSKVAPIPNFAGFAINGTGPDPAWRQPVCKLGAATGDLCGHMISLPGPGSSSVISGLFLPGDDGGPVTSDNLLIGMIRTGHVISGFPGQADLPRTDVVSFNSILDDANANGGPGAGFTPVPAS